MLKKIQFDEKIPTIGNFQNIVNNKKTIIGIDLNDVVRSYSKQYIIYFNIAGINKTFNPDKIKYKGDDIYSPFVFSSKKEKADFEESNYVFEILASAKPTHTTLPGTFNMWLNDLMDDFDDNVEVWFISPGEIHLQRQSTLFFLSKICSRVEHIWFPKTIKETWDKFDVLITANPKLLKDIPNDKITIKVNTEYNKKSNSTYSYDSFMNIILSDNYDKIKSIIKN